MSILADTVTLRHTHAPARERAIDRASARAQMVAALTIVLVVPFERALLTLPGGLTLTTSEAAAVIALCTAAICLIAERRITWPAPLLRPGLAFATALIIAALAAPTEPGNALRFVGRMAAAAAVCVLFVNVATTTARARAIVRVLVGIAMLIGAIAVLERAEIPGVMAVLTWFRPGFHVVAGQLRATSTLLYPTIASMYLEVAFALGLWLLLEPTSRRPRLERSIAFAALVVIAAGIVATFTRAGLIGLFTSLLLVGAIRIWRLPAGQRQLRPLAALGATIVVVILLTHSIDRFAIRLGTEGSQAWYGARYQVPSALRLQAGNIDSIPITLTNTGRLTWDSKTQPPFAMSYHWLRAGSDVVIEFEGERTPFPSPVRPGQTVRLPVGVIAPGEAGRYILVWDLVHETRAWLSTENVAPSRTEVEVTGRASRPVIARMSRLPTAPVRPSRPELWQAAMRMAAERPWLGFGPDNFRHVYGRYAGLQQWDPRVHANNMYLEVLAGAGVVGLGALLWLVTSVSAALWRRARSGSPSALAASGSMLAAWVMIAGHGLVDSFLTFTSTYLTFAMAVGLAFSPGVSGLVSGDADRV